MKTGINGRQRQTSSAATPKDDKSNPGKDGRAENSATDGVAQCSATSDTTSEQALLREKAKIALLREAKRGAERVETMGTQGWRQPSSYATNKRFLSRTLASTVSSINGRGSDRSRKRQRSTSPKEKRREMPIYKAARGEERDGQLPSSEVKKGTK